MSDRLKTQEYTLISLIDKYDFKNLLNYFNQVLKIITSSNFHSLEKSLFVVDYYYPFVYSRASNYLLNIAGRYILDRFNNLKSLLLFLPESFLEYSDNIKKAEQKIKNIDSANMARISEDTEFRKLQRIYKEKFITKNLNPPEYNNFIKSFQEYLSSESTSQNTAIKEILDLIRFDELYMKPLERTYNWLEKNINPKFLDFYNTSYEELDLANIYTNTTKLVNLRPERITSNYYDSVCWETCKLLGQKHQNMIIFFLTSNIPYEIFKSELKNNDTVFILNSALFIIFDLILEKFPGNLDSAKQYCRSKIKEAEDIINNYDELTNNWISIRQSMRKDHRDSIITRLRDFNKNNPPAVSLFNFFKDISIDKNLEPTNQDTRELNIMHEFFNLFEHYYNSMEEFKAKKTEFSININKINQDLLRLFFNEKERQKRYNELNKNIKKFLTFSGKHTPELDDQITLCKGTINKYILDQDENYYPILQDQCSKISASDKGKECIKKYINLILENKKSQYNLTETKTNSLKRLL